MALEQFKEVADVAKRAIDIAKKYNHEVVTLEHVLCSLLEIEDVKKCMIALLIDVDKLSLIMDSFMAAGFLPISTRSEPIQSTDFDSLFLRVIGIARISQRGSASALDVLLLMSQLPHEDSYAITALVRSGINSINIKKYLSGSGQNYLTKTSDSEGAAMDQAEPSNTEEAKSYLKKYTTDLNQLAKDGRIDPLIGRINEVEQIIQVIARRTKNNCVLVGETGVGKTSIVEGLALKIVNCEVPDLLKNAIIFSLDVGLLVAGAKFRGDFEERMKMVLKALSFIPNAILFIDEMHNVMDAGSGSRGSMDVANMLKPALAKGQLRCIGSTTIEEYRKHIEKDRALARRFKKVVIEEPSPEVAKAILRGLKNAYEKFHGVTYTQEAIDAAVDLTYKYVTTALLPDKAIDVIDTAGARQKVAPLQTRIDVITALEIEEEVSKITKIPAKDMTASEESIMSSLEDDLKKVVFGQDEAVSIVTDSVLVSRAGLRDTKKPAGCYLFVGASGVGKTEVARQLAKSLNIPLIKMDMSEYMEKHSVSKFIGSPPGYVGYGEGGAGNGILVNAIDTNPSCVLLLDEIEKAHEDIFNILLQVMDDARLTNSSGKTANFRNVILIMTSNVGISTFEKNPFGFFDDKKITEVDDKAIKNLFRPEFRNRLDSIVKFNSLKRENMLAIVDKFISELDILAAQKNITLVLKEDARRWLAEAGYDPAMGARPLARVINNNIKNPLSRMMIFGELKNGGTAIIDVENGALTVVGKALSRTNIIDILLETEDDQCKVI